MCKTNRYTITAALPYANGPLHIGHMAGVYVPSDIFARYLRRKGKDVAFIGGSDEHGIPITIRAKNEGVTPQDIVDRYHENIKSTLENFGVTFDIYSRTTSVKHKEVAQDFFKTLYENGKFTEDVTEQYYDEEAKEFLADRYIRGECPKCQNPDAYGDQCEKCGSTLSPEELVNPRSALSGNTPIRKETKNWYLPLDQYQDFLKEWIIDGHKNDWKSNVYGQVKSWLDDGLKPRAMTRDLNWGIPVPVEGAEGKVMYVWFDAPIGYISFTQEWAEKNGKDWKDYWQNEDTKLVHFIGKDNIVFHCIIFPTMMKAHGDYIMPDNVPANEFLNLEDDKISTSRNWAVWAHEYLQDFPGQADTLRYVLAANMPENKDNNFTWKDFQTKNNSELVGILGNFINRVMVLSHKYYEGIVPAKTVEFEEVAQIKGFATRIGEHIEKYEFRAALTEYMNLARLGNQFLQAQEPWKKGDNPEEVKGIMNAATQIAVALGQLAEPFLPFASEKILNMMKVDKIDWNTLESTNEFVAEGHQLGASELIFAKIEDDAVEAQINKLQESKTKNNMTNPNAEPQKELISFDDFQKMDIRIGTILEAKKVEKADKLFELKVDTGMDVRTIVSGIAEHFTLEEVVGKQAMVLANLAPRKIRGIESHGMLLFADKEDGKLTFVNPEAETPNGVQVG
ncbi:methionine--tRNA ligase [Faecalibacter rhinopitheci]|uniref:Methionine--tRNA ligase n=1 Tax=Faecalibacter rhinopitheci TaxID=2779678 RepID=A0A8J7G971_9FLAO|nr:methionine--tRNA ligase [Faecalibacter rhinopitheci]MBF0597740.1 methionine--tRNA ligase [Faecalibacter rhinopitheci]